MGSSTSLPTATINPGADCPGCDGIGYVNRDHTRGGALHGAHFQTVSLFEPGAVAAHVGSTIGSGRAQPCARCLGSGIWMSPDAIEECVAWISSDPAWIAGQGLLTDLYSASSPGAPAAPAAVVHVTGMIATAAANITDLLDNGPPVLLRGEEVRRIHNAYLALRFDAERRLAATDPSIKVGV